MHRAARKRISQSGRRRWLYLACFIVLVAVAVGANVGPLTHYRDASARLDEATAGLEELKAQKSQLQGDLAQLSETGHLETLAREQLAWARPGEDLYIVTSPSDDTAGPVSEISGTEGSFMPFLGGGLSGGLDPDGVTATSASGARGEGSEAGAAGSATDDDEGFFEGIISAIRGLF